MKRTLLTAAFCALLTLGVHAAQAPTPATRSSEVPRLLRYSGSVAADPGAPRAGAVGVVFAIYAEQTGGAPLWVETQNVQLDAQGRYTVNLGAVNALPNSIFAANEARWLGVQVLADSAPEQPRVMLVSVPYALKAQDAETLGGRPASAYLLADTTTPTGNRTPARRGAAAALEVEGAVNADEPHTVNAIPKFSATNTLDDSLMFETYNQAAFDAFGLVIPGNEDVVNIGDGTGLRKRLNVTGRVTAESFDINTSTLANSFRVVNDHPDARAMQANARDGGHGFTTGLFASARSNNAAGITAYAYEPDVPNTGDEYAAGVFAGNYNPAGPGVVAWSAYNGTVNGDDFPIVTDPVGLYAAVAHSTGIAAVLDYRNTGTGQLLSARMNGTEVTSLNTAGDFTTAGGISATGTITAAGGFSGSGAGLTGITAASITDSTITTAKLDFDPATQAELDAHKTSGDHDSRYLGPAGGTLTGDVLFGPKGTATSGSGFNSQALDLAASLYNSGNGVPYKQTFRFDVEAVNNNTPLGTFTGRLRLGFANEFFGAPPSPTGISFDPDGTVNAVKFAGDGSLLTNVAASSASDLACTGCVGTTDLADSSVTTAKIADLNITTGKLANGAVTSTKLGAGAVGNSNLADNSVTSAKIQDLSITNSDVSNSAAISPSKISGTAATLSDANVFSTNQTINGNLTLSGAINTGLRVQADVWSGDGSSPNVLGGSSSNVVSGGAYGAFIGGGGSAGSPNEVTAIFGTVAGGFDNTATHTAFVGGGFSNWASNTSAVAGGDFNTALNGSAIGGGSSNNATGPQSMIPGGVQNTASGSRSFAAGWKATAAHSDSFVWSDGIAFSSTSSNQFSAHATNGFRLMTGLSSNAGGLLIEPTTDTPNIILGNVGAPGLPNAASVGVRGAAIGGGGHASIGFGGPNLVTGSFGTVAGGVGNQAGEYGAVAGGYGNQVTGTYGAVAGGLTNTASGLRAAVLGGELNTAGGLRAAVGGGLGNSAGGEDANVSGGRENSAPTIYAAVGGGVFNTASGSYAVVSGGGANQATAQAATVGGGESNLASGIYATVPGGTSNEASGTSSFAAGQRAKATHNGSFVWGDTTNADVNSSADNEFTIRAAGGFRFLDSGNVQRFGISAAGTVTAAAFVGDGSGLTGITAGTANDLSCTGCVAESELAFDPATQAELDTHKSSTDHDARYVLKAGDTMTGTLNLPTNGLVAGTSQLVLASGNVGIGTATPNMKLRIDNTANQGGFYLSHTNTSSSQTALEVYATGTASQNALFVGSRVAGANPFINGLVVKTGGNVGIGTESPTTKLDVAGTLRVQNIVAQSTGKLILGGYDNGLGGGTGVEFNSVEQGYDFQTHFGGWASRMVITDAGNVGIATTSPSERLHVVGNGTFSGTVTASSFSGNVTGSATSFTGSLAGDVTGTQSATTVAKVRGVNVSTTAPTNGQALTYNSGTSSWTPTSQVRGINYIAGCDSCSLLTTSDSQKTIYVNVVGAMTVNEVRCYSDTGTPTINLKRDGSVNFVLSSDLSCSTIGGTTTTFTSGEETLALDDKVDFYVTGGTGAAHRVTVVIKATVI